MYLAINFKGIKIIQYLGRRTYCSLFTKLDKEEGKLERNLLLYLLGGLDTQELGYILRSSS